MVHFHLFSCFCLDFLHLPVCKEVNIVVQEEPEPPPQSPGQLAKRPKYAHWQTLTLPSTLSEDFNDNSWTEPLSSTSSETQDGDGQPLQLCCSESDSDHSDEWEETSSAGRGKARAEVDPGATSHGTESTHTSTDTAKPFSCTVCNKGFGYKSALYGHMSVHSRKKTKSL